MEFVINSERGIVNNVAPLDNIPYIFDIWTVCSLSWLINGSLTLYSLTAQQCFCFFLLPLSLITLYPCIFLFVINSFSFSFLPSPTSFHCFFPFLLPHFLLPSSLYLRSPYFHPLSLTFPFLLLPHFLFSLSFLFFLSLPSFPSSSTPIRFSQPSSLFPYTQLLFLYLHILQFPDSCLAV